MWSWAPIAAAFLTTVVNLMVTFGGYLARRDHSTSGLTLDIAREEERRRSDSRFLEDRVERNEREIESLWTRFHDLSASVSKMQGWERDVRRVEELQTELLRAMRRNGERT